MEGLKQNVCVSLTTCGMLLNSINISFGLVISCSVGADTVGVNDIYVVFYCMRTTQAPHYRFDITSHKPLNIHALQCIRFERTSHPLRVSTLSHIRLSLSTAPHIRLSVSITHHFRWSLKLPNLFFTKDITVPSGTETSHNGF